ncbi:MAG: ribonuclease HII [Deltaproteobacteria bacterium]|nr:ribonuclease HII [Deltaproteobacteria bacterium]
MARKAGFGLVAGVDEAGRGPLAGPVVAAAVIVPEGVALRGVRDSKQMHPRAREEAFCLISEAALSIGIGVVSNRFIDEFDILRASLEAMRQAVSFLDRRPDFVLVDGIQAIPISLPQKCLKRGDQLSLSISAASIIAKVYRDRIMDAFHDRFPEYGFRTNKGYGTPGHLDALRRHGPTPIHRKTFKGVCQGCPAP